MKSLNLKNIAAIATGVVMAGSVITPALAAVDVGDDVSTFVSTIKENLEDTQVIIGSLADVSDAIAGADFVDALREATATEADVEVGGTAGGVTIQQGSGSVTLTPAHYDVEFMNTGFGFALSPFATGNYAFGAVRTGTAGTAVTVTPDVLPDVLFRGDVEAYVTTGTGATAATSLQKYEYQEEIILGGLLGIRWDATDTPIGHGLYLYSPGNLGRAAATANYNAVNQVMYRLNFGRAGLGLPLNNTTWKKTPVINVLKKEYAMDTIAARQTTPQFVLYPGEAVKMLSGETYTTDDGYIVTVEDVGLQGANTGALYVNVRVDAPDGDFERLSLDERQGASFFDDKVSVYVDAATGQTYTEEGTVTGRADLRVGHGKLYFNVGSPFPLDELWTITEVDMDTVTVGTSTTNYLGNVTVRYGSPLKSDPAEKGGFLGNEFSGLKEGVILDGPKNHDGTPVFNIKLTGFGGATKTDLAEVILTGGGPQKQAISVATTPDAAAEANDLAVFHVKWTDRGGMVNNFAPDTRSQVAYSDNKLYLGSNAANQGLLMNTSRPWGMVANTAATGNYHVLYFYGTEIDSSGQTRAKFSFGGNDGTVVYSTPVASFGYAQTATLTYSDIVDQVTCTIRVLAADRVNVTSAAACRFAPAIVVMGSDIIMDRGTVGATTRPNMDLTNVTGAGIWDGTGATESFMPLVYFDEDMPQGNAPAAIALRNFTAVYDYSSAENWLGSTAANDITYTGIVVANQTFGYNGNGTHGVHTLLGFNDFNASTAGTTTLINSATYPVLEANAHHVTVTGSEIDIDKTPGANVLTVKLPESSRNAVITVAETIAEGDEGGSTSYQVGDVLPDGSVVTGVGESGSATAKTYANIRTPVLDSQASGTYQVVIGGPWVNTVAQTIAGNELTTVAAGTGYLRADGNKLLVAGMTGTDTTEAVNKLVDLLEEAPVVEDEVEEA